VIGVRNNAVDQYILAAEYSAGGLTGSGNTLAGDRFYFPLPVQFSANDANGLLMIDNTIAYLVPEPGVAVLALVGGIGLFFRRRRH
jgi:hypothetical protein